jgi:plastocyanin
MKPLAGLLLGAVCVASCGGGSNSPTTPAPNPSQPTITITAAGVSPRELTVAPGTRVLFINEDQRRHDMASDPHPEHDDCPDISVGLLTTGQRRETRNLVTTGTCGFHDHENPDNQALKGRIIIR